KQKAQRETGGLKNIITLKMNVANGCPSSRTELAIELPRIQKIKNWAIENDELITISLWLANYNAGQQGNLYKMEIQNLLN
ncbi:MAG: hypothetical protein WCH21_11430, partial [Bacteroidota bacterium]